MNINMTYYFEIGIKLTNDVEILSDLKSGVEGKFITVEEYLNVKE